MSRRQPDPIQISEYELLQATEDLNQFHNDTFGAFRHELAAWSDQARERAEQATKLVVNRRAFLIGGGAAAVGGLALAACGGSNSSTTTTTGAGGSTGSTAAPSGTAAGGALTGDAEVAGTAASLENLAVAAYQMGISAAKANKIGTVPPAVVTFAETAMSQHAQHAKAFNAVVTAAGGSAVSKPDPALLSAVEAAFGKVTDVGGLANLALELEETAANTYEGDLGMNLSSAQLIGSLASIQPVERMHVSILLFVLGMYPVPETFQSPTVPASASARPPGDINSHS